MDYIKTHDEIIFKAKNKNRKKSKSEYFEQHHILPKCLGGSDDKNNLVLLTAREHFLIHWLLHLMHPKNKKLFFAFDMMCIKSSNQNRYIPSSRIYEYLKKEKSKRTSGENNIKYWKNKKRESISGENHPIFNNEALKNKISESLKGHVVTQKTKNKISKANKGKTAWNKGLKTKSLTKEHKNKISKAKNGKKNGKMSEKHKNNIRKKQLEKSSSARKVVQKDKNDVVIKIFNSVSEAIKECKVSRIFDVLSGKKEFTKGYKWQYLK